MREIRLTKDKVAVVDDEDYAMISKRKWRAIPSHGGICWYAAASVSTGTQPRQQTVYMHRLILGAKRGEEIDHLNGDGLDNRRSNLRFCTRTQNQFNLRKHKPHSSQFKGVGWNKQFQKWRSQIGQTFIGYYNTEEEAARAYDARAKEVFGDFAYLNFST